MLRSNKCTLLLLCGFWLGSTGVSHAEFASATFDLGQPTVTPTEATFDVGLTFEGSPGDTIEALQLSVLDSHPLLTANGTDFSRFSFTPNPTTLPGWLELAPGFFSATGVSLYGPADPVTGPFVMPSLNTQPLGILSVDLLGLPVGEEVFVTLAGGPPGLGTDVGGMVGTTLVPSFAAADAQIAQLSFVNPEGESFVIIPEPSSTTLLGLGVLGLLIRHSRRRLAGSAAVRARSV